LSFLVNQTNISLNHENTFSMEGLYTHNKKHTENIELVQVITQVFWINDLLQKKPFPKQLLSKQKKKIK